MRGTTVDLEHFDKKEQKKIFHSLLQVSLTLYDLNHLSFSWTRPLKEMLSESEKADLKQLRQKMASGNSFTLNGLEYNPLRLKHAFELYFEKTPKRVARKKKNTKRCLLNTHSRKYFPQRRKNCLRSVWRDCL
jgi:hypothetical protein